MQWCITLIFKFWNFMEPEPHYLFVCVFVPLWLLISEKNWDKTRHDRTITHVSIPFTNKIIDTVGEIASTRKRVSNSPILSKSLSLLMQPHQWASASSAAGGQLQRSPHLFHGKLPLQPWWIYTCSVRAGDSAPSLPPSLSAGLSRNTLNPAPLPHSAITVLTFLSLVVGPVCWFAEAWAK